MFCRNCGKQLDDNAIICPQCGVEVNPTNQTNANYNNNNQTYGNQGYNNNQNYYNRNYNNQGAYNNASAYAPRPAPKDKSNTIAVVGFVLSFFFAIAGLVCSIIGYNKAKNEGLDNKGLALAGIIISAIEIAAVVILIVIYIIIIVAIIFGVSGGVY